MKILVASLLFLSSAAYSSGIREVYFYKCFLSVPKSGQMTTWGMAEGLGRSVKAAHAAAYTQCLAKFEELAPGACKQAVSTGMNWDCDWGVWIPFSDQSE